MADYNFSHLEKDEKTYKILIIYTNDFKIKKDISIDDNKIQCEEMKAHNNSCGRNECEEWIKQNAKKYRAYLNAIKVLATIIYCNRSEITWENFCYYVDRYNECEDFFLDRVFLNK